MTTKPTLGLAAGRPSASPKNKAATLASLADTKATKRVNFNLTEDEHLKLKVAAAKQGKSITQLLTDYVRSLPDE
ncbi:plasmid partition protein ParB [Xanthomonas perforans]|uniref:Chromosome partitioning protein ParB n=1 Tax=Xanthomonas perforans TaxID=442694 RepID=A0A6P0F7S9_XANPE|nr:MULTISPECIES: plasmid partition protein ParG [Gammaproteobacteria]HAT4915358.1 chromosome partitioning protein ParB [Serratia marcescens]ELA2503401.1 chromosome partitioning protein ParB [Klebsiella pneumoniae]KLC12429.1 plasmid partition protein ParB [Xanthomonas perforans]KLC13376.1 plasmid partition protein ParB [Xanthomonas perforans]KLC15698.1 plasmid partition protein ParB [Xanthomonas perforans]